MKRINTKNIAIALDNITDVGHVDRIVSETAPFCAYYKVGLELFCKYGPSIVHRVQCSGKKVFLDLKLHDIPNTVAKAVRSAKSLGADLLTVHSAGGHAMLQAAVDAAAGEIDIIAVTVLTSLDQKIIENELSMHGELPKIIAQRAELAAAAGCNGIVCSAADLPKLTRQLEPFAHIITPGIRLHHGQTHDQKRIATPRTALHNGATLLVVGRAITASSNMAQAAESLLSSMQ